MMWLKSRDPGYWTKSGKHAAVPFSGMFVAATWHDRTLPPRQVAVRATRKNLDFISYAAQRGSAKMICAATKCNNR